MSARGVTELNDIKEYRYFAGGEWRTAENHKLCASAAVNLRLVVAVGSRSEKG